jgi:membrane protease YdiL (CAAX protease family)
VKKDQTNTPSHVLGDIHWQPDRDTLVAFGSYVLVVAALYTAFQIFTTDRVAANFITFGPIALAGLGVALPALYTALGRHRPVDDLGLTTQGIVGSLVLGLLLGWDTYTNTLAQLDVVGMRALAPLVVMSLAVGLFEAIFFRGWLQLRFEKAFGRVPGLILGAGCYSLYHIGYGMEASELLFLFGLGLVFSAVFRLTRNVFVLWPFYTPIGGLYTNLSEGLSLPFESIYGFAITIGLMVGVCILAIKINRDQADTQLSSERRDPGQQCRSG